MTCCLSEYGYGMFDLLLCLSAPTLKAKSESLLVRQGLLQWQHSSAWVEQLL